MLKMILLAVEIAGGIALSTLVPAEYGYIIGVFSGALIVWTLLI